MVAFLSSSDFSIVERKLVDFMGSKFSRTFYRFQFPVVSRNCFCISSCSTVDLKYNQLTIFVGVYIWALYSVLLICLFLHQYHSLYDCSFIVSLKVRLYQSYDFLFYQYCVYYRRSFALPYKLCNQSDDIHKITLWDFDWDYVESTDKVRKN